MGAAAIRLLNSTDEAFVGGPWDLALSTSEVRWKIFSLTVARIRHALPARQVDQRPLFDRSQYTAFQIRIASMSPPRRIPLTEWPFRLCNIEARIGYPEHFAQHRELTGTHASGLGCI